MVLLCKRGESNCGAVLSQSLTFKCLIDKLLGKWNDLIEGFVFLVLFVAWSSMLFLDTEEDLNVLHALAVSSQISCVNVIVRDLVGSVSGSTVVNASSNGNGASSSEVGLLACVTKEVDLLPTFVVMSLKF